MRLTLLLVSAVLGALASPASAASQDQDQDLERALTANPWCMVAKAGDKRSETASFGRDGAAVVSGDTGPGGVHHTERFRWRVRGGTLLLSDDGTNWTPIDLKVGRDGTGRGAIVIDGDAYRPCR